MNFKLFFKRKTYLIYILSTIIVSSILTYNHFINNRVSDAVILIDDFKTIRKDFSGDGQDDILYIKNENNKYYVQINIDRNTLSLDPSRALNTLGTYCSYWPMKIQSLDLNRNKVSELFIQSSDNDKSITHIFTYRDNEFVDIFCSNNNIIGFLDTITNKTPKFISANYENGKITKDYYMFIGKELKKIEYETDIMYGLNEVSELINYIQNLHYNASSVPHDAFYPNMESSGLFDLWKMAGLNTSYKFQDAIFSDAKYNSNSELLEIKWTLNFTGTSLDDNSKKKLYTVKIRLKSIPASNGIPQFKISAFSL